MVEKVVTDPIHDDAHEVAEMPGGRWRKCQFPPTIGRLRGRFRNVQASVLPELCNGNVCIETGEYTYQGCLLCGHVCCLTLGSLALAFGWRGGWALQTLRHVCKGSDVVCWDQPDDFVFVRGKEINFMPGPAESARVPRNPQHVSNFFRYHATNDILLRHGIGSEGCQHLGLHGMHHCRIDFCLILKLSVRRHEK